MKFVPLSNSITRRLLLGLGAAHLTLSSMTGAAVYWSVEAHLKSQRQALLQDRIDIVTGLLKSPTYGLSELKRRIEQEWPERAGEKVYIRVVIHGDHEKTLAETPNFPEKLKNATPNPTTERKTITGSVDINGVTFITNTLMTVSAFDVPGAVLILAVVGDQQAQEFLNGIKDIVWAIFAFSIFSSLLLVRFISKRAIQPLHGMAGEIERIDHENLHTRVNTAALPVELHGLSISFNNTLDRLTESFERLSKFSSDMAHEIRTPITNIRSAIDFAMSYEHNSIEHDEALSSTIEECSRIQRIVESLLFLARAESSQARIMKDDISIGKELNDILEFYEPFASEKSVQLVTKNSQELPLIVLGDKTLFQRAIGNLIANAIHYTSSGGVVTVSWQKQESYIAVTIVDTGTGISEEDLPHIFNRFYRTDQSRSSDSGGTGLGLAIVKSIVTLHGGRITVGSTLNKGSEFSVFWPWTENIPVKIDS